MCMSYTSVSEALNINQTSESRIVWCLEETDSCGSQREYDELPGGRRRLRHKHGGRRQVRQTDRGNKRAVRKKKKVINWQLLCRHQRLRKRANGRQIKLDYNSGESSAHCGQQSVFADLSALRVQICITTGSGSGSFALFLFYLFF